MASIECTPTAVRAPPGASSGCARQLSTAMNCAVEVVWVATIDITVPSWPSARRFRISTTDGWKRRLKPTASTMPARFAAATAASALGRSSVNGFSTWTCLPATAAAITCSACALCGVASTTASMSGLASASSKRSSIGMPRSRQNSSALARVRV